ncbi:hypothetical protein, variant [Verruconis gallopava]|nr:hypothetical protein, variant [Verruconis gallopava]KIW00537.1 hypothetical protein, variant [Verruconis gallopava]
MGSRYYNSKRSASPGAQRIVVPGRSSDTGFISSSYGGTSYAGHMHGLRDDYRHPSLSSVAPPRKTTGVIPISTEIVYKDSYPLSASSAGAPREAYTGRPRRSSDLPPPHPSLRSRPAAVVQEVTPRPLSPLSRSYEPRDSYVKSNTSVRRSEPKAKKLYNVGDDGSAKLIAETEEYRDSSRRERAGYHLTGRSHRPREVDESAWSYTDAVGMYNETEPIRRPRRGSVDGRRPTSVLELPSYAPSYHRNSRDYGPPPSTRQFDRVNNVTRNSSVREPVRGSSRDRKGSYDTYGHREPYEMPLRPSSTMPVVVNQPEPRHARDETYYPDDYDDYREPRRPHRQFTDENVQSRGFGIRMPSVDRHAGGSSSSSAEPPIPRSVYPQASALYSEQPLVKIPSSSEYVAPAQQVDDRWDKHERREREYDRDRLKDWERPREREYERDDRSERHHHRRSTADGVRDPSIPNAAAAATAAAGLAGAAAVGANYEKKRVEKRYESEDERTPWPRRELNDREDERERRYAERDRDERDRRDRDEKRDREDRRDREEKRREEKPVLDPDEDYRRRVQQAQAELGALPKSRSKEDERNDSERDRQRRREREERERERRQSRDRDSRRGSDDNAVPKRSRAPSVDSHSLSQHNRPSTTDRGFVQEPESMMPGTYPREAQATAGAMPPPPPPSTQQPPTNIVPPTANATLPVPDVAPRSKSVDPSSGTSSGERRVTIVEPPKDDGKAADPPLKGILRKPTEKFPEHPTTHREGVTPLKERLKKENGGKEIPEGAKWTKIDRRLVNPQALEEKGERFEERQDCVIVLRVLTKDEIQVFANRTAEIREEREQRYHRERKRHSSHGHRSSHHERDTSDDSDNREYRHSSRRSHRDDEKESHRHGRDDGGSDRDREQPRSSRKDSDKDKYESENEAVMRAIEEGRRKDRGSRDLREEYMSGALNGR